MRGLRRPGLLLALVASAAAMSREADPLLLRASMDARCALLAEVRTDERAACWYLACDGAQRRTLGCDLTAMHQIVSVDVSPDRHHLAVLSVGEGHPLLELVPVAPLLKSGEYAAACTINPYPGTLSLDGWQDGRFRFSTDVDLGIASIEERVAQMGGSDYRWLLDPLDGQPQRVDAQRIARP